MSFYSIPTLLGALSFLVIGLIVFLKNRKAELNLSFAFLCLILFNWEISYTICYSTKNPAVAQFFADFACTNIAFAAPGLYWLAITTLNLANEKKWLILSVIITIVQLPGFLFTDLFLEAPHEYFFGYYSNAGPWHPFYLLLWYGILARPFLLVFLTFMKIRKEYSIEANRTKHIALAYMLVCFCSTDYIPKYGIEYYPFGFLFGVIFAVIIAYAIVKYQLMDIRVVISRIGIFLTIYIGAVGIPLLISLFGQSMLTAWIGEKWWLIPLGVSSVLASLSPFLFTRVWRRTEAALMKKLEEKEMEAATDDLTGLLARRAFMQRATQQLDRARKVKQPCCLMMIDLDHFKKKNDTYGHLVGDLVLMETAHRLTKMFRQDDLIGRYGGEEFIILLPYTKKDQAQEVAERLRQQVCATAIRTSDGELEQTISVGLAAFPENGEDIETLIANADKALYQAKEGGRNRVMVV